MITTLLAMAALTPGQFPPPIAAGKMAPLWTAKNPDGKTLSLKGELQGRKAMLLNFWFYG